MAIANDAMGSDKYAAEANSDLSSSLYCGVKLDTNAPGASLSHDFAVVLPSAGERVQFLVIEPGGLNKTVHLCGLVPGKRYIGKAAAAITLGAAIGVDAAGAFTATLTSGDAVIGWALGAADGAGSQFSFIAAGTGTTA